MHHDPSAEPSNGSPEQPQAHATHAGPEPSYAPFLLALGITMIFWGIATSPVMSAGGFVLFTWALWLWISAIARDWKR